MTPRFAQLLTDDDETVALPDPVVDVYGRVPPLQRTGRLPALAVNFAASLDGKISFGGEHTSAQHITSGAIHDRWLMALLRARVDVVLVGAGTLWADPGHEWSSRYIFPEDVTSFERIRRKEDRSGLPGCVVVSHDGALPSDAGVLTVSDQQALVATTEAGADRIGREWPDRAFDVVALGSGELEPAVLLGHLGELGHERVLCEGGPRLYASLVRAAVAHDLYLTVCSLLVGGDDGTAISLGSGVACTPASAPRFELRSVRAGSNQVFLRYRTAGR